MNRRAIGVAMTVVIAIVAAVLFWTTRQQEQAVVETAETISERPTVSEPAVPEPTAPATATEHSEWFPDLSHSNSQSAPGTADLRDTFGCDISRLFDDFSLMSKSDEGARSRSQLLSVLGASGDAEMLLAAWQLDYMRAHLENGSAGTLGVQNLERALAVDPMHPVALWNAAMVCGWEPTLDICGSSWLNANIETVLGSNGEYWSRKAANRYGEGDSRGALDALRRAATAPEFDSLGMERTRILERGFSVAPDLDPLERTLTAFVMSLEFPAARNSGLISICSDMAEQSPEWRDACLDLASRYLA